jgi:hypothetical protein
MDEDCFTRRDGSVGDCAEGVNYVKVQEWVLGMV